MRGMFDSNDEKNILFLEECELENFVDEKSDY